jgi:polysaccharide biosynthesis/export protein VpsN
MNRIFLRFAVLLAMTLGARARTTLEDYDMFQLTVKGAPPEFTREYERDYTVADGFIYVPNIGPVKTVGLTPGELAGVIARELRDRKIFTKPEVIINVVAVDYTIPVGGAVRKPNCYPLAENLTLSRAVAVAGGPAPHGEDKVRLFRKGKVTAYSRKAIRKDPAKDPKLLPGDYVEVAGEY